ncbi:MAG TPA: FAD-dependent oxidoreductase, partial [Desulfobacterales bacterium]|nr:FAD-dependent oxidoreductase [Desulfobacterales bacterium]
MNPDAKLADAGVNVVIDRVTRVDRQAKKVFVAGGAEYAYDKLILSTGSSPILPPIPGRDLEGVFMLRSLQHAEDICKFLSASAPRKLTF